MCAKPVAIRIIAGIAKPVIYRKMSVSQDVWKDMRAVMESVQIQIAMKQNV